MAHADIITCMWKILYWFAIFLLYLRLGYNPYVVGTRIREIMEEEAQLRMEISPIYSEIILKHSSYKNPQQDRWGV